MDSEVENNKLPNGHKKQRLGLFSKPGKVLQKYQSSEDEFKEVIPATK